LKIERVEEVEDPRLDPYRDLAEPLLATRRGLFVAEGRECVRILFGSDRFETHSALMSEAALAELRPDFERAAPAAPLYVAPPALLAKTAGLRFHQGCLALGIRPPEADPDSLLGIAGPRRLLALDTVTNPDNVGAAFRNAAAFGVDGILLSEHCADPLYRKAIRTSMGSTLRVPFARVRDWSGTLSAARAGSYLRLGLTPAAEATPLGNLGESARRLARVVLIAGSEGDGLSTESESQADLRVRIEMAPDADSVNVGTATGIALHWLASRIGGRSRAHKTT
jgi:tRNA G18 (ribose-2'-O)-methylase SpoU